MWLWRQISYGLRSIFDREEAERDLTDEVRQYLEDAEADLVRRGATPEEARRAVRLQYGDSLQLRETVRAYGWETVLEELYSDLRHTLRRLRRSPGFTVVVTLILGLGIGSAATILSVVSPVLFQALPYPDADRVLRHVAHAKVRDGNENLVHAVPVADLDLKLTRNHLLVDHPVARAVVARPVQGQPFLQS